MSNVPIQTTDRESIVIHDKQNDIFYFECPHCSMMCQVPRSEIRCTIFRHAIFKKDFSFVPPHAPKITCDKWIKDDIVYGCAKPFKFDGKTVSIIDYI
jgi:hypothetical protein